MKVFLTGGTGFIGKEIVKTLIASGHAVSCLVRNPGASAAQQLKTTFGAQLVTGDVTEKDLLIRKLHGIDAVIHLVGIISEVGKNTFENIHVGGTENIVTACLEQRVKRFIQMSALGTRPNAVSRYHQTKWAAEEIVRTSGLDYTIFRPSLVYGPNDKFVNLFVKIIRLSPIVPLLGRSTAGFQPVSVEVVARAFVACLGEKRAGGQTYDLAGPETFTLREMVEQISRVLHKRRVKIQVPRVIARLQASLLKFIYPVILRKAPPLNRDQLLMLEEDNVGNAGAANELFGLKQNGFAAGISEYL